MKKILFQGIGMAAVFLCIWLALSQIDFLSVFKIPENRGKLETKLGEVIWESIEESETVIKNDSVNRALEKLFGHICRENNIDSKKIKLHIIEKDEINAFALPAGHLVVYTGLMRDCENESQLAGVIGHEIAHIEKDHVMKKLIKEFGLATLASLISGGQDGGLLIKVGEELSSSAYDRSLESEADMESVDYLQKAHLNPSHFADFMYKISRGNDVPDAMYWISTHPESEERALSILEKIKGKKFKVRKILSDKEWKLLHEN